MSFLKGIRPSIWAGAPLLIQCCGLALNFLAQIAVARAVGPDDFGLFSLVTAWLMFLAVFARWGNDSVVLRYGAGYFQSMDFGALRRLVSHTTHRVLLISSAICAAVVLASLVLMQFPGRNDLVICLMIGLPVIPLFAVAGLRQSTLLVLKRTVAAMTPEYLIRPAMLLVLVLTIWMIPDARHASWVVVASVLACLAALVVGHAMQSSALDRLPPGASAATDPGWRQLASRMLAIGTVYQLIHQADMLVAGWLLPASELAHYAAAKQVASVGLLGLIALQSVYSAQFAAAHSSGDEIRLSNDARLVTKIGAAFATAYLVLVIVGGKIGLAAYGGTFVEGRGVLTILCLAHVVNAMLGPAGVVASMSGLEGRLLTIFSASLVVSIPLMFALGRAFGGVGIATAVLLTTVTWGILINYVLVRKLGFAVAIWFPRGRVSS